MEKIWLELIMDFRPEVGGTMYPPGTVIYKFASVFYFPGGEQRNTVHPMYYKTIPLMNKCQELFA